MENKIAKDQESKLFENELSKLCLNTIGIENKNTTI
jgi:hypothetical protein